ncbi:hypothetical protein Tco_0382620 [Tanacetum coccineum]
MIVRLADNGCLDCGSDSEAEDGSDNSMVVDEGEQDFTNPTDRRKFGLEDDQASLKLKDSNDETDAEALQSPVDRKPMLLTPEESIKIQFIMALDDVVKTTITGPRIE